MASIVGNVMNVSDTISEIPDKHTRTNCKNYPAHCSGCILVVEKVGNLTYTYHCSLCYSGVCNCYSLTRDIASQPDKLKVFSNNSPPKVQKQPKSENKTPRCKGCIPRLEIIEYPGGGTYSRYCTCYDLIV